MVQFLSLHKSSRCIWIASPRFIVHSRPLSSYNNRFRLENAQVLFVLKKISYNVKSSVALDICRRFLCVLRGHVTFFFFSLKLLLELSYLLLLLLLAESVYNHFNFNFTQKKIYQCRICPGKSTEPQNVFFCLIQFCLKRIEQLWMFIRPWAKLNYKISLMTQP